MDYVNVQNGGHVNKMATKLAGIVLVECSADYTVL